MVSSLRLALAVGAGGPGCGGRVLSFIRTLAPHQCSFRFSQTLLTAGTIFFPTKLALRTWFGALYQLIQSKGGVA